MSGPGSAYPIRTILNRLVRADGNYTLVKESLRYLKPFASKPVHSDTYTDTDKKTGIIGFFYENPENVVHVYENIKTSYQNCL